MSWRRLIFPGGRQRRPAASPAPVARRRQRGVAIILTLGILSLVIVLAITFAATAVNSARIAQISEEQTNARGYADLGLQRLVASLRTELNDYSDPRNFYPANKSFLAGTGAWSGNDYYLSTAPASDSQTDGLAEALAYSLNGIDLLPPGLPPGAPASWLPVYSLETRGGSDVNVLKGRYAFILVDESGKLDPDACVSASQAEGSETAAGFAMTEIDLTRAGLAASLAAKLRPQSAGGSLAANSLWFSTDQMVRALGLTQSQANTLLPVLCPGSRADQLESTIAAYDLSLIPSQTAEQVVAGIPWLQNWWDAGTYISAGARARQIAANLIDYCDLDRNATSENTTDPAWFGLEAVPCVSRVQFYLVNASANNASNKSQPVLQVYCQPELLNMHGDLGSYTGSAFVRVVVEIKFKNESAVQTTQQLTFDSTLTAGASGTAGNFSGNGYLRATALGSAQSLNGSLISAKNKLKLTDISARLVSVQVRKSSSSDWWDWAKTNASATIALASPADAQYLVFRAYNPMNNLNAADWTSEAALDDHFLYPYTSTAGQCPDLWNSYPLYIRNAPMQSLAELAAIYRMEPYDAAKPEKSFRTLNLVDYKYNGSDTTPGQYSDAEDSTVDNNDGTINDNEGNGGDRNLLDMVRLGGSDTDAKSLFGRININTHHRQVLEALFKRVSAEPWPGGAAIDSGKVDTLITNILNYTRTAPLPIGLYSKYRNSQLYGLLFQDGMTDLPMRQRACLALLTQQLVSAEHNYFRVIVAAQAIKDVGAVPPKEMELHGRLAQLGRYDEGSDRIIATQRLQAVLYRNAFTNRIRVVRVDYLD